MIRLSIYKNGNDLINGFATFWDNIYVHIKQGDDPVHHADVHSLLAEWGARMEGTNGRRFVCFEREDDVTAFLLRWS